MLIWFNGLSCLLSQRKLVTASREGVRGKQSQEVQFISEENRERKVDVEAPVQICEGMNYF